MKLKEKKSEKEGKREKEKTVWIRINRSLLNL